MVGKLSLRTGKTYCLKASTKRDRAWRRWIRDGLGGGGDDLTLEETLFMIGLNKAERRAEGLLNPELDDEVLLEEPDLDMEGPATGLILAEGEGGAC